MAKFDYNSYLGTLDEYDEPIVKRESKSKSKVKNNTEKMSLYNKIHKFKKNNTNY